MVDQLLHYEHKERGTELIPTSGRRASPVVARRELRRRITRYRLIHYASREEAASALGWSKRIQDKIETGDQLPLDNQLDGICAAFEVPDDERAEWVTLRTLAKKRAWWDVHSDVDLSETSKTFIGYECGAVRVRAFSGAVIPVELQIPAYRAATLRSRVGAPAPERVDQTVDILEERQKILFAGKDPLEFHLILDESALHRHLGGNVMVDQLAFLIDWARIRDNITIQVVPYTEGIYRGLDETFTLLDFGERGDTLVYLEATARGRATYLEGTDVYGYSETFTILSDHRALSVTDTLANLDQAQQAARGLT